MDQAVEQWQRKGADWAQNLKRHSRSFTDMRADMTARKEQDNALKRDVEVC